MTVVKPASKTFVICCNEIPKMVVIGDETEANRKREELREINYKRAALGQGVQENWCLYEVERVGAMDKSTDYLIGRHSLI